VYHGRRYTESLKFSLRIIERKYWYICIEGECEDIEFPYHIGIDKCECTSTSEEIIFSDF
jgi:hypothetical protein